MSPEHEPAVPSPLPLSGGGAVTQQLPKGRHGLSRAFIASNQRERLLDAIANVVAEKGYASTRVADITEYAGVSRKTFYELFSDKEDCFLAAYDAISALLMDRMAKGLAAVADEPWEQQVSALLGEFLRFLAAEPAFARMCIVEVLGSGPRGLAKRDATIEAFFPVVDQIPRAQAGAEKYLSELTPVFVTGGILEVVYAAIRRGDTARLPELEEDLTRLAFRAYLYHKEWETMRREP
ncbi:MAG TPA: TetR/AcrR family transcriptional regulator [Baekduia sp.]|uniref:TetR/AcrR family transcriptional regulator n=1 Tax=Baekduia sp. TaxID=2600305 RepID=UPI002D7808A6|nr:TetR/AcrR family transcriptional regulator [Baekduia sp.]HET6507122.1 TetR/AcrR family transcriptional regulator [Baekduia sp.]